MLPLFVSDVPLHCINEAAHEYNVPAKLIISVIDVEQGKVGLAKKNKNGTYDLGPMQINTIWWPKLYKYRITMREVLYNPCINVTVGTWILGKTIANGDDLLQSVGNYNSNRYVLNQRYLYQVRLNYTMLNYSFKNDP